MSHIRKLPFESLDAIPLPILLSEAITSKSASTTHRIHRFINKAFINQIGYSISEIPDIHSWFDLAYPDKVYRQEIIDEWELRVAENKKQGLELVEMKALIHCKDGERRWFNVIANINEDAFHVVTFLDVHELTCAVEEKNTLSLTDSLTNLANRRHAQKRLDEENKLFQRTHIAFSLVVCDVDYFKHINDEYGHTCGDLVLSEIADAFKKLCREIDCISRWGGDEFLIILPATDKQSAILFAERLRETIAKRLFKWSGKQVPVTMSFGCAEISNKDSVEGLVQLADEALYRAKAKNRNAVSG